MSSANGQPAIRGAVTVSVTGGRWVGVRVGGEVFPNAPLQFVVCEIAYPPPSQEPPHLPDSVKDALGDPDAELTFAPPGLLRAAEGSDPEAAMFRLVGYGETVSVTVWRRALVIEHSDYQHWSEFRALLASLVKAVFDASPPPGVGRIGLRYVDEVHVPDSPATIQGWAPYVHEAFLWPTKLVDAPVVGAAAGFGYQIGSHRAVNVRAAMLPARAVASTGPLRLRQRPDTPAFLLDCDGFYQPPELDTALASDDVVGICDELHTALDKLFDDAFTDIARNVFRGTEAS